MLVNNTNYEKFEKIHREDKIWCIKNIEGSFNFKNFKITFFNDESFNLKFDDFNKYVQVMLKACFTKYRYWSETAYFFMNWICNNMLWDPKNKEWVFTNDVNKEVWREFAEKDEKIPKIKICRIKGI